MYQVYKILSKEYPLSSEPHSARGIEEKILNNLVCDERIDVVEWTRLIKVKVLGCCVLLQVAQRYEEHYIQSTVLYCAALY